MKHFCALLLALIGFSATSQIYYPPNSGSTWQTISPEDMGYCPDSVQALYDYLENTNTDAFLLLKDGKIILEKYFGTFTQTTGHVWNSAGKTLTAIAVGIAQKEGHLSIYDTTSHHIGAGWTSLTPQQEEKITIWNQLTMTSGLDDGVADPFCTDPDCLVYKAAPGTRWAYHNAPYTMLDTVIEAATGVTLNTWINQKIKTITGMTGLFVPIDYNNIYFSNARSMARFGILLLSEGIWDGTPVLDDPDYFDQMTNTSQNLNRSYGYLIWLNGKQNFMIPGTQIVFPGSLMPAAPDDMFSALGKESQLINVVPSTGMVLIRMGQESGTSLVSTLYNDTIWQYINRLEGCTLSTAEYELQQLSVAPNPVQQNGSFAVTGLKEADRIRITDAAGKQLDFRQSGEKIELLNAAPGIYFLNIKRNDLEKTLRIVMD